MGERKRGDAPIFSGREQTHLKQFLFRLFEDGCPPEDALEALRSRFDVQDLARAREFAAKHGARVAKDIRGPRGKG